MVNDVAISVCMNFGFSPFPFLFCNIIDAFELLRCEVLQVDNVKKISRPNCVREVVVLAQGVDHCASRPGVSVRIIAKLDEFVKNVGELFRFVIDCDIPCGGIMVQCGKELIKLFGSPAWVREGCTQPACSLNEFALPVRWVISGPFLVDGGALNGT